MKISRRTFLAGGVAAAAATLPSVKAQAAIRDDSYATLIDLSLCDGCKNLSQPACVTGCRDGNKSRFPDPDPSKIKDYWPQNKHEDWTDKKHLTNRFTPYNWIFVQNVEVDGQRISIPRRCMHCDNPPCAKLCPFGVKHKTPEGPVYIDENLCFGGAKCRTVCPWSVPQRQAGVGIYTYFQDIIPAGGGVMYKCDLCRDRLKSNQAPFCIEACPQKAMKIGRRTEIFAEANCLQKQYDGYLYGMDENGGTSTIYVSKIDFQKIDSAIVAAEKGKKKKNPQMHQVENVLSKHSFFAKFGLAAPLLGVGAAFILAVVNRSKRGENADN